MPEPTTELQHVRHLWNDDEAGASRRPRSPGLSIEQARRGPHADQHRRRQHVVEADRARPAHGATRRGALGEGLRRRPAHGEARRLRVALPRQGPRDEARIYVNAPERGPEDADRRRDVPDVQPLRLQPEPARLLDRHAAAHLRAVSSTSITCTRTPSSPSPRRSTRSGCAARSTATTSSTCRGSGRASTSG